jgi:sodium pump decarboxylase gamma subunit
MTIVEMLKQCALLAVLGMAIVFAFLWVMIICMNAAAKLIRIMGWDKDVQQPQNGLPRTAAQTVTPAITAAITAAVAEYREKEHRE